MVYPGLSLCSNDSRASFDLITSKDTKQKVSITLSLYSLWTLILNPAPIEIRSTNRSCTTAPARLRRKPISYIYFLRFS